jgi:lysophospholipase L1-like esterase
VGKNGDPKLKTDAFAALITEGLGDRVDIAFHKYCFADIYADTDIHEVFRHYKEVMARLQREYPRVTFVHVTTPLVVVQAGPKAVIKKLLGRMPDHYADNMRREEYNDLMRQEFRGKEPLFDLAAIESTRPDGTREIIEFRGSRSFALFPGYSDDGAHLDDTGRRRVAGALLVALAELADRP